MNKYFPLLAVTLLLASPAAWPEADRSADLRYCLEMKSNKEIAKCAGEISSNRSRPYSKREVETILNKEENRSPVSANKPLIVPAASSGKPGKD